MIKTIIFDFGNVFINLKLEEAYNNAFKILRIHGFTVDLLKTNKAYEEGLISTDAFIAYYQNKFPGISKKQMIELWNFMLMDFPKHRLDFLKRLQKSKKHKLILLSNTNELHINWIKEHIPFYESFKNCFDAFYLSHKIHLSKPDKAIFEFVLNENNLNPDTCFFIDDTKQNTDTAESLGIKAWTIQRNEDVCNLFKTYNMLFN